MSLRAGGVHAACGAGCRPALPGVLQPRCLGAARPPRGLAQIWLEQVPALRNQHPCDVDDADPYPLWADCPDRWEGCGCIGSDPASTNGTLPGSCSAAVGGLSKILRRGVWLKSGPNRWDPTRDLLRSGLVVDLVCGVLAQIWRRPWQPQIYTIIERNTLQAAWLAGQVDPPLFAASGISRKFEPTRFGWSLTASLAGGTGGPTGSKSVRRGKS